MPQNRSLLVLGVLVAATAMVLGLAALPDRSAVQPLSSALPSSEDDGGRPRMEHSGIAAASVEQLADSTGRRTVDESAESVGAWAIQGHVRRGSFGSYAGVPLVVQVFAGRDENGELLGSAMIHSDGEGNFAWVMQPPAGTVMVLVTPDLESHYVVSASRVVLPGDPAPDDLRPYAYALDAQVHGRVVDEAGNGVAAARVIAPLNETLSDEAGRYTVSMAANYPTSTVRAIAAGYAESVSGVGALRQGDMAGPDLVLRREYAVRGRVIDEHGAPVAGATVCTYPRERNQTLTDDEGCFRLGCLDPKKQRTRVSALHSGFVSASVRVEPDSAEAELELVLRRGASLAGRVVTEAGKPVADAQVSFGTYPSRTGERTTRSDALGAFSLDVVPEGNNTLWATLRGWAPASIKVDVPGSGDSLVELEIMLRPGFVLAGIVLDQDDQPMAGAQIQPESTRVRGIAGYVGRRAITGADGRFLLDDLTQARVLLRVWAEGCSGLEEMVTADGSDLVLRPQRAGRLAGRVVDGATGEPLDSFVIRFVAARLGLGENGSSSYSAEWRRPGMSFNGTDGYWDSGSEALEVGSVTGVEASAPGYAMCVNDYVVVPADPNAEPLLAELQSGATLRGFVVNAASGSPLAGARVRRFTDGDPDGFPRFVLDAGFEASTNADGGFEFEQVPLGTMYLFVDETELPLAIDGPFEVQLNGSAVDRSIQVGPGGRLVGRLLDGDGRPLGGEIVSLYSLDAPDDDREREATTDAEGAYSIGGLVPGQYHLRWVLTRGEQRLGHDLLRLIRIEDRRTLEFDLRPGGHTTLRGTLEFEGELPENVWVTLSPEQEPTHWAQRMRGAVVEDGTFVVTHLEAGAWNVHARSMEDGQMVSGGARVVLPSEGTVEVTVTLRAFRR